MDETLRAFIDTKAGEPVPEISLLLDNGSIVSGAIVGGSRFSDDLRVIISEGAAMAEDPAAAEALHRLAAAVGDSVNGEYLTIGEPLLALPDGSRMRAPVMRIRADSISAWWARTIEPEDGEEEDYAEGLSFDI